MDSSNVAGGITLPLPAPVTKARLPVKSNLRLIALVHFPLWLGGDWAWFINAGKLNMAGINPWEDEKDILSGFKLGDPGSALILARRYGLLPSAHDSSSRLFPYHSSISSTTPSIV